MWVQDKSLLVPHGTYVPRPLVEQRSVAEGSPARSAAFFFKEEEAKLDHVPTTLPKKSGMPVACTVQFIHGNTPEGFGSYFSFRLLSEAKLGSEGPW